MNIWRKYKDNFYCTYRKPTFWNFITINS